MADKKRIERQLSQSDLTRRDPETDVQQPEIKPVVNLLASILSEVQKQIQQKQVEFSRMMQRRQK